MLNNLIHVCFLFFSPKVYYILHICTNKYIYIYNTCINTPGFHSWTILYLHLRSSRYIPIVADSRVATVLSKAPVLLDIALASESKLVLCILYSSFTSFTSFTSSFSTCNIFCIMHVSLAVPPVAAVSPVAYVHVVSPVSSVPPVFQPRL